MPNLFENANESVNFNVPGTAFNFSGVRPENLGATEYTLVSAMVDTSGSVDSFSADLLKMLKEVVAACQKHPRKENLMMNLATFNDRVDQVHGFVPVMNIDSNSYPGFNCGGMTSLHDACVFGVGATETYAKTLVGNDFDVNAVVFVITDGEDNRSVHSAAKVAETINRVKKDESLLSVTTILIGLNTMNCRAYLDKFKKDANIDQFVDVGDVTPGKLAKLAQFISHSISSSSQALATKSASVPVSMTF